jgi:ApbE superfamily uncharacterized protein (UPF0280 family)
MVLSAYFMHDSSTLSDIGPMSSLAGCFHAADVIENAEKGWEFYAG